MLLLLLAGALVGGVLWLDSRAGHRWLVAEVEQTAARAGYHLRIEGLDGSLWRELQLASLSLEQDGTPLLSLSRFRLRWQPLALLQRRLRVEVLSAGDMLLNLSAGDQAPPENAAMPLSARLAAINQQLAGLSLPLAVELDGLSVGHLALAAADPPGRAISYRLTGSAEWPRHLNRPAHLALDLAGLDDNRESTGHVSLDLVPAAGSFDLNLAFDDPQGHLPRVLTGTPHAINARLAGEGSLTGWQGQLQADVTGLATLKAGVQVAQDKAGALALTLTPTIKPTLAPGDWPDSRLATLLADGVTGEMTVTPVPEGVRIAPLALKAGPFRLDGSLAAGAAPVADLRLSMAPSADAYGFVDGLGWGGGKASLAISPEGTALTGQFDLSLAEPHSADIAAETLDLGLSADDLSGLLDGQLSQSGPAARWHVALTGLKADAPNLAEVLAEAGNRLALTGKVALLADPAGLSVMLDPAAVLGGQLAGHVDMRGGALAGGAVTLDGLPVAPLLAMAGQSANLPMVDGALHARVTLSEESQPALAGRLWLEGGRYAEPLLGALLGPTPDVTLDWPAFDPASPERLRMMLTGAGLQLAVAPTALNHAGQAAAIRLALGDLSPISPALSGDLTLAGQLSHAGDTLTLDLAQQAGKPVLNGRSVAGLSLRAGIDIARQHLDQASLSAEVDRQALMVSLSGLGFAEGLAIEQLVATLPGNRMVFSGSLGTGDAASLRGTLSLDSVDLGPLAGLAGGDGVTGDAVLTGKLGGTLSQPTLMLDLKSRRMSAPGMALTGMTGTLQLAPADVAGLRLSTKLSAKLRRGGEIRPLRLVAGLDVQPEQQGQRIDLNRFELDYGALPVRLVNQPRLSLSSMTQGGLALDDMQLTLGGQPLDLGGMISARRLAARVSVPGLDLARLAEPAGLPPLSGILKLDLSLIGDQQRLDGKANFSLDHVHLSTGNDHGPDLPDYRLTGRGSWDGRVLQASIDGRNVQDDWPLALTLALPLRRVLAADSVLAGVTVPAKAALNGHLAADLDLASLNQFAEAAGHRLGGTLNADLALGGPVADPQLAGAVTLVGGSYRNLLHGVYLHDINARLEGSQRALTLTDLKAVAPNGGTITGHGKIEPVPGGAVDLALSFNGAQILQSDLVDAVLDGPLTVKGGLRDQLVSADLTVQQAEFRIPKRLPASVTALPVEETGGRIKPAPEADKQAREPPIETRLDIRIKAPDRVFVRGLGLDVQVGGTVTVGGTAAEPVFGGGFALKQGRLDVLGQTWQFDKGGLRFPTEGGDPVLDIEASRAAGDITAIISVTGPVSQPVIDLHSEPPMAEGEIASRVLFGTDSGNLSAVQAVQATELIATLEGHSGQGVLGTARSALGLDQLSVDQTADGANLKAGRYLGEGIYVGVSQGVVGDSASEVEVQVDITDHIKVEGATGNRNDNRVGVSVEWDY